MSQGAGEAQAMKAVAEAVTGAGSPEAASVVSKPERDPVWAIILAGPAVSFMLSAIIWSLAFREGWPADVALARIQALGSLGMALIAVIGLIIFRLGSGSLKRFEAKALSGSIAVETGGA